MEIPTKFVNLLSKMLYPMNPAKMMPLAERILACKSWHNFSREMKMFLESICSNLDTQVIHPRVRPMKEWMRC
jgi:hypothetical protein